MGFFEQKILPSVERRRPAYKQLESFQDMIRGMIQGTNLPINYYSLTLTCMQQKHLGIVLGNILPISIRIS